MPNPDTKQIARNIEKAGIRRVKQDAEQAVRNITREILKEKMPGLDLKKIEKRFGKLGRKKTIAHALVYAQVAEGLEGSKPAFKALCESTQGASTKNRTMPGTNHGHATDRSAAVRFLVEGLK